MCVRPGPCTDSINFIHGQDDVDYVIVIVHYVRIYGSKPPRTRAKPRMVYVAINSYVVDNKCYIYPLE